MQKRVYGFVIYVEQKQCIPRETIAIMAQAAAEVQIKCFIYKFFFNAQVTLLIDNRVYAWRLYECLRNGDIHQIHVISFSTDNNVLKGTARAKGTDLNN